MWVSVCAKLGETRPKEKIIALLLAGVKTGPVDVRGAAIVRFSVTYQNTDGFAHEPAESGRQLSQERFFSMAEQQRYTRVGEERPNNDRQGRMDGQGGEHKKNMKWNNNSQVVSIPREPFFLVLFSDVIFF